MITCGAALARAACACGCGGRPRRSGAEYIRGHRPPRPLAERLWARVDRSGTCWPWGGYCNRQGYGQIGVGRATEGLTLTHRVAYAVTYGPIPDAVGVLHRCDNPPCCNPAHLFLGDQAVNMRDAAEKGRARGANGSANWNAKLTATEVGQIRDLDVAGLPRQWVAKAYNISPQHVGAIARRQARKAC